LLNPIEGQRAGLVRQNAHPDFFALRSFTTTTAKPSISVEAARVLLPFLGSRPALGGWRVVLIDAIDEMNRNAANAVLKSLEEPPANTLFLLVCHAQGQLLPTIRSRCLIVPVKPLPDQALLQAIQLQNPDADADKLTKIAAMSGGTVATALSLLNGNGFEVAQQTLALLDQEQKAKLQMLIIHSNLVALLPIKAQL
jgi:DNA polymerase-3 subunit delta'